jgi:hypothetical protein
MPVIGKFSAVKDGYAGVIRTLMLNARVRIVALYFAPCDANDRVAIGDFEVGGAASTSFLSFAIGSLLCFEVLVHDDAQWPAGPDREGWLQIEIFLDEALSGTQRPRRCFRGTSRKQRRATSPPDLASVKRGMPGRSLSAYVAKSLKSLYGTRRSEILFKQPEPRAPSDRLTSFLRVERFGA